MRKSSRGNRELWGLIALFAVFLASVTYYERVAQETLPPTTPSSFVPQGAGVKALYLLLKQEHFKVDQWQTVWNSLPSDAGLLVVVEPLEREVTGGESAGLHRWIEQGGSLLYLTNQPNGKNPEDTVTGDIEVVKSDQTKETVSPAIANSPYTRNVGKITVASPVRLSPDSRGGYTTLFRDGHGIVAVHKSLGKGQVIVLADTVTASNAAIKEADNAVLFVDIAAATTGATGRTVVFDEYHHGVGFTQHGEDTGDSLLSSMPLPMRFAVWHLLGLSALIAYNGNRRFGRPRLLRTPVYRPSTDYVGSMAKLYRRAGGADIALTILYKQFLRDLRRRLDVPPDAHALLLAPLAAQKFGVDGPLLHQVLARCEQVVAGERIFDNEMFMLISQLEDFRRRCDLVGTK